VSTVALIALGVGCGAIEGVPRSRAPGNECPDRPCEAYAYTGTKPTCVFGRCDAGRATFDYVLVVSVPTTSFFAAGRTFTLRSREFSAAKGTAKCPALTCIALPPLVPWQGEYRVAPGTAAKLGVAVGAKEATVPALATFVPRLADGAPGSSDGISDLETLGLPSDVVQSEAVVVAEPRGPFGAHAISMTALVPQGNYERRIVPAEGYDALPPVITGAAFAGQDVVSDATLDDPSGDARRSVVRRKAGLDGFRVFIQDAQLERRVSAMHLLSGVVSTVRLDTIGENDGAVLRNNLDVVVAPPLGAIGVPTYVSAVIQGVGLDATYPDLPPPVAVSGVVVTPDASAIGLAAEIVFDSTNVALVPTEGVAVKTRQLRYRTWLRSDARGRFATVLPPGEYLAYVRPDRGLGWGRQRVAVSVDSPTSSLTLPVLPLAVVEGRAVLADGRPLVDADVVAEAAATQPDEEGAARARRSWLFPRGARGRTDGEGRYVLALEQGTYDLTVIPEPGSGFPRVVSPSRSVAPPAPGAGSVTLEPLRVPVPARIGYTLQDPSGNVIPRAVVRAYARLARGGPYLEIGEGVTDRAGRFEILVSP
jgi:hypothetical protein